MGENEKVVDVLEDFFLGREKAANDEVNEEECQVPDENSLEKSGKGSVPGRQIRALASDVPSDAEVMLLGRNFPRATFQIVALALLLLLLILELILTQKLMLILTRMLILVLTWMLILILETIPIIRLLRLVPSGQGPVVGIGLLRILDGVIAAPIGTIFLVDTVGNKFRVGIVRDDLAPDA